MILRRLAPALLFLALGCSGEEFSATGSGGSAGSGAGGTGAGGGTGGSTSAASCKQLLAKGTTASGVHTLVSTSGIAFSARCEMEVAGGGWTLLARSADGALQGNGFGWRSAAGSPDDPSSPYSLDVATNRIQFSEIMLALSDDAYGIVKAFVGQLPAGFLKDYATAPYELVPPVQAVVGDCNPPSGVSMLSQVGYTDQTDVYFVRDHPVFEPFGLREDGWQLGESTVCDYNADFNWKHGMLFVR